MKQLLLFFMALVALTLEAQEYRWVSTIGSTNVDVAQGINTDAEGNIYVFGTFRDKVDFDPGVEVFELSTNNSTETDPFFMKLDKDSNLIWAKNLTGKSTKTIKNLGIDKQGNVYIIGTFYNKVDFNTSTEVADTFFMTSGEFNGGTTIQADCFLSKYDKDGNFILAKSWGYKKSDFYATQSLAIDEENNIYIAGYLTDTLDLGISEAQDLIIPQSGKDGIIYKISSEGVMLWKKHLPCKGDFQTTEIAVDEDGKSYVSFYFKDTLDLVPGNEAFKIISGDVEGTFKEDLGILKLDSDGTPLWVKTIGGAGVDKAEKIMVVNNAELLICGTFTDTVDFDPGVAVNELKGRKTDIFVLKLTKEGEYIWAKNIGGNSNESTPTMDVDGKGNIFVSGAFSNDIVIEEGDTLFSYKSADIFISKLTPKGNLSWVIKVGSVGSDAAGTIAADSDGNVYLTGKFATRQTASTYSPVSPWMFNPANDSAYTWTAAGSSSSSTDIYIAKYGSPAPSYYMQITGVTTTSSQAGMNPINMIDLSGIDTLGNDSIVHSWDYGAMFASAANVKTMNMFFSWSETKTLTSMILFNHSHYWPDGNKYYTNRGLKDFRLYYSDADNMRMDTVLFDNPLWIKVDSLQLLKAMDQQYNVGETFKLNNIKAKWLAIEGISNWGGNKIGLNEIILNALEETPVIPLILNVSSEIDSVRQGSSIQIVSAAVPAIAADKSVVWEVVDATEGTVISPEGVLTAGQPGMVTVKAKSVANLNVVGTKSIKIFDKNSAISKEEIGSLKIYPNPSTGRYNVTMPGLCNGSYSVFDATGRLISKGDLNVNTIIDITGSKAGIYLLQLTVGEKINVTKLMLK